jgi:site-specific DNA-adenine methylase
MQTYLNTKELVELSKKQGTPHRQQITPALFPWAGGKKWLGNELKSRTAEIIQPGIDAYCEPFFGGGGAFREVADTLLTHGIKKVVLNDFNPLLINLYVQVQTDPEALIDAIVEIEKQFALTIPEKMHGKGRIRAKHAKEYGMVEANRFYKSIRTALNKQDGNSIDLARV